MLVSISLGKMVSSIMPEARVTRVEGVDRLSCLVGRGVAAGRCAVRLVEFTQWSIDE